MPRIGRSLFGLTRQRSYNSIHRAFVPLAVGTRLGSYEVVSAIGAGGMGEVYRAHDLKLGRSVALKVLPAAFAADSDRLVRFEREAQLLASLNHPHIAAIYGLEEATPVRALVLELVDGDTLADRLARESGASAPALPIEEAISIGRQIADALDAAHEQGIVHRDLKPSNIKVRADGTVKVLDFGLAKLAVPVSPTAIGSTVTAPPMQTEVGMILGTPAYMAPEHARGLPADKRSDMWAFGCILYEMLTGRRLFDGEHSSDTIALVLTKDPDWRALPITLPSAIRTLLRRCLERDSHRRLGDAATARFVLEEAGALSPARDATDVATSEHGRRRWWMRTASVAAGALVVGASSAALFMWMRTPPDEPRVVRTNRRATDDGRWLAYESDVSGRMEVYVTSYPAIGASHQPVSTTGGSSARWSPDGRSLFFVDPNGVLMSVAVQASAEVWQSGMPIKVGLSLDSLDGSWYGTYDVAPDGRFVVIRNPAVDSKASQPQIVVVQHLDAELAARRVN